MTTLIQELSRALGVVRAAGTPQSNLNPIYRALPTAEPSALIDGPELDLLVDQLTAPAVMVVAVESAGSTRRIRVGIHAGGATVESSGGSSGQEPGDSHWARADRADLPRLLASVLPEGSPLSAPPRLTVESAHTVLRLDPAHLEQLRELVASGHDPQSAFGRLEGLDPRLQDALTAQGDRVSLSLTLHSPDPARLEKPVSIARLWNCGELGIYRTDTPDRPAVEVVPVEPGDVLGTTIPLLEQAIRFASGLPPTPGDEDPATTGDEEPRP